MSAGTRLLSIGSVVSAAIGGSLLHPFVTGQVAHTTNRGAPIGDGLLFAAGSFIALALVFGLVGLLMSDPDWVDRLALRRRATSTTAKRGATLAVVGLVVTTGAIGGIGGGVDHASAAVAVNEDCSNLDLVVTGATLFTSEYFKSESDKCLQKVTSEDVTNLTNTDANASAESARFKEDTFLTSQNNFAEDSRSVAWSKAKISIVNDLNNNVSEANATQNAKDVVDEYYATREKNLMAYYSAQSQQAAYLADTPAEVKFKDSQSYTDDSTSVDNITATMTVELVNGANHTFEVLQVSSSTYKNGPVGPFSPRVSYSDDYGSDWFASTDDNTAWVRVNGREMFDVAAYEREHDDIQNQASQVNANIDVYVNETYMAYEAGEINATDLAAADPQTIGTQASTDYNTTGYYGMASAQLAALGLSGNESVSHTVNTTANGSARTITGTVFYTGEDSQTFSTGTTYDPANLTGEVYMSAASVTDGSGTELNNSGSFYHVNESFTIVDATDTRTGEAVENTTMETRDYSSTNASKLQEEIQLLQEQRDFYEQQLSAAGGGSTGSSNTVLMAAIALAVGAALMYRRDDD